MKKFSAMLLLALLLALAACGGSQPEPNLVPPTVTPPVEVPPPAVPPTEEPAPEPALEPAAEEITHQPDPALIDVNWQWVSWTTAVDGETPIADPTRYTIRFNADGTANVQADCNTLILNYASDNGAISFMRGISTLMSCPDESLEHTFNTALNNAALYFFQDGDLLIDLFADGGTMRFVAKELVDLSAPAEGVATGTVTAPNGVFLRSGPGFDFPYVGTAPFEASGQLIGRSEDQQWWAVAAPGLEAGRVWVSAAFVEAENADSVPVIWPEPELTGQVWQWVSLTTPLDETAVANPTSYTITFNEDGSANVKADCNVVVASYTRDGSAISITPGITTAAACPEDSLSDQFVANLSAVAVYFFLNGDLYLDLFASSGTMRFVAQEIVELPASVDPNAPRGTVTAPDGIFLRTGPGTEFPYIGTAPFEASGTIIGRSANGQWWLADTPNLPGGQAWASARFVEAVNVDDVPVVAAPALRPALQNVTWQWVSFTSPVEMLIVNDPGRYTIRFNADGTAGIRADCNTVRATFTTSGSGITILPGPSTLVACPPDSLDQQFLSGLNNAVIYFFQEGDLYMDTFADGGTLRFIAQRAGDSGASVTPPEADEPVAEAAGLSFQVVSFGPLGAVQPVLEGTTLTAVFSETEVSGTAGCNNYSGPINRVDDFFTVGPIASTLMLCDEPIMQQEQAFLAALGSLIGYQWRSQVVDGAQVATAGQLFYSVNGINGVINLLIP